MTAPILAHRTARTSAPLARLGTRPSLAMIPGGKKRVRWWMFCSVAFGVLGLALTLALNVAMAQGAYELAEQRTQSAMLAEQEQVLREELEALSTPSSLCAAARAHGMVPAESVGFIRLSTGEVTGASDSRAQINPATGVCLYAERATVKKSTPAGTSGE